MMTFRPGQRLIVPGVQVLTPLPSGASTWWDNNGAISGCVARDTAGNLPYLAAGTYYVKSMKAGFTFTVDTETVS